MSEVQYHIQASCSSEPSSTGSSALQDLSDPVSPVLGISSSLSLAATSAGVSVEMSWETKPLNSLFDCKVADMPPVVSTSPASSGRCSSSACSARYNRFIIYGTFTNRTVFGYNYKLARTKCISNTTIVVESERFSDSFDIRLELQLI
ncbi:uncharacterized protein LOC111862317 [Cryptotermes secundus]|uniref:uncharacterized protein LOC111862317 n=1 Tax=Cryptotermes secundus TaxID=105785 RepID=UPI000CD7CDC2|nr:uncharacterized protein LOC111862317 [Cryptotermes secundus]